MSKGAESIAHAETELAQARAAVRADYQAAKARLRASLATPAVIGGVFAGAFATGYVAACLRRIGGTRQAAGGGAVAQLIGTARVFLPLLLALVSTSVSSSASSSVSASAPASRAGRLEAGGGDDRE